MTIVVFGPGFGESILIRAEGVDAPEWAVIDSARRQRRKQTVNPAVTTLQAAQASPSLVVLTHSHLDHTSGMADVVERVPAGGTIGYVDPLVEPPAALSVPEDPDDDQAQRRSETLLAHIAIRRETGSGRLVKWSLCQKTARRTFAGWDMTVLHPAQAQINEVVAALGAGQEPDLNNVSAALLVERNGVRVVLAADCEAEAWQAVSQRLGHADLRATRPIKVPHHGSRGAIHPVLIDHMTLDEGRPQAVTPFPRSGRLPRFEPGQGADLLLRTAGEILLTALPVDLVPQSTSVTLDEVRGALTTEDFGGDPAFAVRDRRPRSTTALVATTRDPTETWALFGVHLDGRIDIVHGAHAVRLTR